jgi:phosphoglycerate dehydrogenase-like enzyme
VDRVDLEAAEELGVRVINTPAAATDAVADLTVAFMLQLLRPVPRLMSAYQAGDFHPARQHAHGQELRERTVGIVGMGRIGSRVARTCALGFGARVLYNDIVPVGPWAFPAEPVDKPTLWHTADIITLHVPLTHDTRCLVDAAVFARMSPRALLINTARGAVVDTAALVAALARAALAGAALDVTDPEPLPAGHPLLRDARCILTPHIAARTHGGLRRRCAVGYDVLEYLRQCAPAGAAGRQAHGRRPATARDAAHGHDAVHSGSTGPRRPLIPSLPSVTSPACPAAGPACS